MDIFTSKKAAILESANARFVLVNIMHDFKTRMKHLEIAAKQGFTQRQCYVCVKNAEKVNLNKLFLKITWAHRAIVKETENYERT